MKKFFEWLDKKWRKFKRHRKDWIIRVLVAVLFVVCVSSTYYTTRIFYEAQKDISLKEQEIETLKNKDQQYAKIADVVQQIVENQRALYGNESIYAKDIKPYTPEEINFLLNAPARTKKLIDEHGTQNYELRFPWMIFPVEGYISNRLCEFGVIRYGGLPHTGLDIAIVKSLACRSADDGIVMKTGYDYLGGYFIIIGTEHPDYKKPICNYYGHLEKIEVEEGQAVLQGDRIGLVGATGEWCFGRHLHWSIKIGDYLYNPVVGTTWYNRIEVKLYKREGH